MPTNLPPGTLLVARASCLLASVVWASLPQPATAAEDEVIYQSAPARVTANVEKWGSDCGVRPKSYTLNERPEVRVVRKGDHLVLYFPSGPVRSNLCWSQNPALQLVSTSARPGAWKTRCETPQGDPKSETGVYEIVARDAQTLELTESSRYDWQLKSSHCVATVRTVRTLTRLSPVDEQAAPMPVAEPAKPAQPGAQPEADCVPGSLARLRLQPHRVRVEPGKNVCFVVHGEDADGCAIRNPPVQWSLKPLDHGQGRMNGRCFRSADSAAEGEGRFRVTARAGKLSDRALVRVATPDLSDITLHALPSAGGGGVTPSGEAVNAGGVRATTRVAARALEGGAERNLWLALLAGVAALGGVAAWLAARRRAAAPAVPGHDGRADDGQTATDGATRSPRRASPTSPRDTPPARQAPAAARPTEPMICPQCRRGYPPGAERCEGDGTTLITYKAFTAQSATGQVTCKACGTSFADASAFCGKCGARLPS